MFASPKWWRRILGLDDESVTQSFVGMSFITSGHVILPRFTCGQVMLPECPSPVDLNDQNRLKCGQVMLPCAATIWVKLQNLFNLSHFDPFSSFQKVVQQIKLRRRKVILPYLGDTLPKRTMRLHLTSSRWRLVSESPYRDCATSLEDKSQPTKMKNSTHIESSFSQRYGSAAAAGRAKTRSIVTPFLAKHRSC